MGSDNSGKRAKNARLLVPVVAVIILFRSLLLLLFGGPLVLLLLLVALPGSLLLQQRLEVQGWHVGGAVLCVIIVEVAFCRCKQARPG